MADRKFKVLQNEKVGRYAVANKNYEPGEVIFTEPPFAIGPKVDTVPICLGCYAFVDGTVVCSKCKWPVCGEDCENVGRHANAECKVFRDAKVEWQKPEDITMIDPQFDCITPLRTLLETEENVKKWKEEVEVMVSHNDKRKEKPTWEAEKVNVVNFLRTRCQLDRFSEDLIHKVCGILEVNAYEAPAISGNTVRGLYPQLGIISHTCVPNTAHSITAGPVDTEDFQVTVRASVKIPEGSELYSCYAYVLLPTILRRETLLETKYFDCDCKRCNDPTELGTHIGSLKCTKCDNGLVISTDPKNLTSQWKCTHCEFSTRGEAVKRALQTMQLELDSCDDSGMTPEAIEARETIARKYRSILHPRHYIHTAIRQSLSQLYGRVSGYTLDDLPDLLLERKVELCREILKVLDILEPGYTRLRGLTLYELHAPLIFLARNEYQAGLTDETTLRKKLNDAAITLEESANILCLEPESTAEGSLGLMAKQMLQQFRDNMDSMIASL